MTQQHPIVPPPDKIHNWLQLRKIGCNLDQILIGAAQWGADQELEACCEYLVRCAQWEPEDVEELRAARRPKPQSLKRVALLQLDVITKDLAMHGLGCDLSQIRSALESIPDQTSEGD